LNLNRIPPQIAQLTALQTLDLSENQLTAIPPEITQLTALQTLFLGQNQITAIPSRITQLTALQELYLYQNQITAIPPEIAQLTGLDTLSLNQNLLIAIPPEIARLTALRVLHLNGNQIAAIPPEVAQLTALRALYLGQNQIAAIPREIAQLTALLELYLNGNQIAAIPPEVAQLTELRMLHLDQNQIAAIPPEITQLTALRALYLGQNQIAAIPPEIAQLTALHTLSLDGNQITAIPPEIGQLTALHRLSLNRNQITSIPPEIGLLRWLEEAAARDTKPYTEGLWLDENPLPDPYPKLLAPGQPNATINVLAWLRGELDPATLDSASPSEDDEEPSEPPEPAEDDPEIESATRQRPAAFRFGLRDGKIDALPETAHVANSETARDLHTELLEKARALQDRLVKTNSDKRAQQSIDRLLSTLGTNPADVRPGLLLSRSRSIKADRSAFNTPKARRELFPEAIAMMDDVLLSLHDLLAVYPDVRQIEAEQLALAVQRNPTTIRAVQRNTDAIKQAAADSDAATDEALAALKEHDADIEAARNTVTRAGLLADHLLVVRNFASEGLRAVRSGGQTIAHAVKPALGRAATELGELSGESWKQVKTNLPEGIGTAARLLPVGALAVLLISIAGPVGGLAALSGGFKELAKAIRKFSGRKKNPKDKPKKPKQRKQAHRGRATVG
jgi:Leucine-rich repeat (LRR) protein